VLGAANIKKAINKVFISSFSLNVNLSASPTMSTHEEIATQNSWEFERKLACIGQKAVTAIHPLCVADNHSGA
jgi:hypothetical protein